MSFHIPFEVQTGWDFSFLILPCPVPVQVTGSLSEVLGRPGASSHLPRPTQGCYAPHCRPMSSHEKIPQQNYALPLQAVCAIPFTRLSEIKDDILSFTLPPRGAKYPATCAGKKGSDGFCVHKPFRGRCKPLTYRRAASLLHPLWMMLKKLRGDGSSAETALPGHVSAPQHRLLSPPCCPRLALLLRSPPPPKGPPAWGLAPLSPPSSALGKAGPELLSDKTRLTTAQHTTHSCSHP